MSEAFEIGKKLVELCKQGKFEEAVSTYYSPDVVSVEAQGPPGKPLEMKGIDAVKGKGKWWVENHEIHKSEVSGPWPHGDRFIIRFDIEITPKEGPMKGKRFTMSEAGLYTVKGGKVVHEEFFYNMGG